MALAPDLILFNNFDQDGLDALQKIAPTAYIGNAGPVDMVDRVNMLGEVTGKQTEAQQWIDDYEQKVKDTQASLNLPDSGL